MKPEEQGHMQKKVKIRKPKKDVNSYIVTIPNLLMTLNDYDEHDYLLWDYRINFDTGNIDVKVDFIKADEVDDKPDAVDNHDAEDP